MDFCFYGRRKKKKIPKGMMGLLKLLDWVWALTDFYQTATGETESQPRNGV